MKFRKFAKFANPLPFMMVLGGWCAVTLKPKNATFLGAILLAGKFWAGKNKVRVPPNRSR